MRNHEDYFIFLFKKLLYPPSGFHESFISLTLPFAFALALYSLKILFSAMQEHILFAGPPLPSVLHVYPYRQTRELGE